VRVNKKHSHKKYRLFMGAMTSVFVLLGAGGVSAETLESALARAYGNNPDLNAQRANVRATDESVAQAKSGYRPQVNASADISRTYTRSESAPSFLNRSGINESFLTPRGFGVELTQSIFNGFRTENGVRAAESNVLSSRETLNNTEQGILLDGATAYMDVLRDTATLDLQRNNVEVIDEQLRQTRDRFNVGEVTRTDVAQAEARLAAARSQQSAAESTLRASIATYRQIIGADPQQLAPGRPLDRLTPRNVDAALKVALNEHPAIKAAQHAVDVAELQVKIEEGALAPQLGVSATVDQRYAIESTDQALSATVGARLNVPIYDGGQAYASTRRAKELAGQSRLQADSTRDQVRAAVTSSWGRLEAARAQIVSAQAQIDAAETALSGVREEARVGQRTTLDVLNAQQELLNARVNLITAQRDRVVASYSLVSAMGRLNSRALGLAVNHYSPKIHYDQVKDQWIGLTTPDGR
jgi:outer membrane protein